MKANINLLTDPDNIEKIRDQIAAILKLEFMNQHDKAREKLEEITLENNLFDIEDVKKISDKELFEYLINSKIEVDINPVDFNIGVYLERERPWQLTENSKGENPFPLVNVKLAGYKKDNSPGDTVNRKKYIGDFVIDCYAQGSPENTGFFDDTDATLKAWRLERIVRNVLMSGCYTYLGMRDVVRRCEITEVGTGAPTDKTGNIDDSAVSVTICRILLSVLYHEDSPQVDPVKLEGISFKAIAPGKKPGENGEILIDI
jgi:hypothetical protein